MQGNLGHLFNMALNRKRDLAYTELTVKRAVFKFTSAFQAKNRHRTARPKCWVDIAARLVKLHCLIRCGFVYNKLYNKIHNYSTTNRTAVQQVRSIPHNPTAFCTTNPQQTKQMEFEL